MPSLEYITKHPLKEAYSLYLQFFDLQNFAYSLNALPDVWSLKFISILPIRMVQD